MSNDIHQALTGPLPGNWEAEAAESCMATMDGLVEGDAAYAEVSREAQIHATLAAASEQRTANLIAVAERTGTRALLRLSEDDYEEIARQLRARLGLEDKS